MKVTNEKTENSQTFLTIEMEPAEVEESLEKAYHSLVQRAKIPGFRKGKAPRALLERYIGKEGMLEEALDKLIPEAYAKAVKEQGIEAIAQPQLEITKTDPVIFKAVVPLKPKVKLGDYQKIKLKPEPVEVTEKDVNDIIEQLRHQHAIWEPVDRPADFDDLVVFDVESKIEDKPFVNQKRAQYQVLHDLTFPAPGFSEQLAGMKKDEEKEFKLQLPADYPTSERAGKEAWFKVKIAEIKHEVLPELNDEFAKEVDPEIGTLSVLQERVSSDLKLRAEEKTRLDFEEKVIDAVIERSEVEFPPILIDVEINRMLNQRFQSNQQLEEYLRSINKTAEQFHEELHPVAAKRVSQSLVLSKVAEEEKIEVAEPEINTEIGKVIENNTENKEELEKVLNTPESRESIGQALITRKTVQRLVDMAKGSEEVKEEVKKETKTTKKTRNKKKEEEK